jgi:hypothetical protein
MEGDLLNLLMTKCGEVLYQLSHCLYIRFMQYLGIYIFQYYYYL